MGATIHILVTNYARARIVQAFELQSDMVLIDRETVPERDLERWTVRSDLFPDWWEGVEAWLFKDYETDVITVKPILQCDIAWAWAFDDAINECRRIVAAKNSAAGRTAK